MTAKEIEELAYSLGLKNNYILFIHENGHAMFNLDKFFKLNKKKKSLFYDMPNVQILIGGM